MDSLNPYNFIFELPLYTSIKVAEREKNGDKQDAKNVSSFLELMNFRGTIDAYNPYLKQETTYKVNENPSDSKSGAYSQTLSYYRGTTKFEIECVRNQFKIELFIEVGTISSFDKERNEIETIFIRKIGQTPSIADLHISKIKQYDTVLSKKRLKEFTRGIGLAAAGVGIGSFVYLRRIFEGLVEEAHSEAINDIDWDNTAYLKDRMADKIDRLKHHLPSFLVENKAMYSILSKGIHELEENECLEYFEALKVGIELILDEKVERAEKTKKIEEAKRKLSVINQKVGTPQSQVKLKISKPNN